MKLFQIPVFVASLFGLSFLSGPGAPIAHADFTFGEPAKLAPFPGGMVDDSIDCISSDELEMYIESQRPGGLGEWDLWVLKRGSKDEDWGPPENLGPLVNSAKLDAFACISADGLTLYFCSNRVGATYNYDIYVTSRVAKDAPWGPAVSLGPTINNPNHTDGEPRVTADGLELYFESWRPGGYGRSDIYVARRATMNDPWGEAVNLGPIVNSAYTENHLSLSPDGLLLLFSEFESPFRPGGYGGNDMWMTRRASLSDPWQAPVNLGPKANGPGIDLYPLISPDGHMLFFLSSRADPGMWQVPILPIVDFTGDGAVDLADLVLLIDNWGTSDTLYDIGPYAWGDGVVDVQDLKAFIAEWEKINPPAQP